MSVFHTQAYLSAPSALNSVQNDFPENDLSAHTRKSGRLPLNCMRNQPSTGKARNNTHATGAEEREKHKLDPTKQRDGGFSAVYYNPLGVLLQTAQRNHPIRSVLFATNCIF